MPRDMSGAAITATEQQNVKAIVMVDLDYQSAHLYAHNGVGTLTWNGHDFIGVGNFGSVSSVQETAELQASGITLTLSGTDGVNLAQALNEYYQGRLGTVYIAFFDANYQLIVDPVILFRGRMDTQRITLGALSMIEVGIENPLADWNRPRVRRYNNQDQQILYPGDRGLEFVEQSTDKPVEWSL